MLVLQNVPELKIIYEHRINKLSGLIMFASQSSENKMSSVCSNCGTAIDRGDQFCDKCGFNLEKDRVLNTQKQSHPVTPEMTLNSQLQGYIQLISVFEIVIGFIALFIGVLLIVISPGLSSLIITSSEGSPNFFGSTRFFETIFIFTGSAILAFAAIALYSGFSLYNLKNSGRFGTLAVSCLMLILVPFGTIFGIISLLVLSKPETIELLRERNRYL